MRPPRHLLALFILLTLVLSILLLAFGWRLLQQDHALERQQAELRREEAADLIVSALEKAVRTLEEALRDRDRVRTAAVTPDSIALIFDRGHIEALPYGRLLYHPVAAPGFTSPQADALLRAAADLRSSGAYDQALAAYTRAAGMSWTAMGEVPTELFARAAKCDLLAALGRTRELRTEAIELRELLLDGRWRITRPVFASHLEAATRWSRAGEPPAADRLALSAAVERLWTDAGSTSASRSTMTVEGVHFTVFRQKVDTRETALIAGPIYVERVLKAQVRPLEERHGVRLALMDGVTRGDAVAGSSRRSASDTGLPWTVVVRSETRSAMQDPGS